MSAWKICLNPDLKTEGNGRRLWRGVFLFRYSCYTVIALIYYAYVD